MENLSSKENRQKINSLQAMRGLAFLGIFLLHSKNSLNCQVAECGMWGVSIFIVMSGFLMTLSYYDKDLDPSGKNNLNFAKRKIGKLYPLHIVTMFAAIVIAIISLMESFSLKRGIQLIIQVILHIFMLQSWVPQTDFYFSLNGVSWYLTVCVLTYFVFPYILQFLKKSNRKAVILFGIITFLIQIVISFLLLWTHALLAFSDMMWPTYICPLYRCGDFIIGCCAGYIYKNRRDKEVKQNARSLKITLVELFVFALVIVSNIIYNKQWGILGSEPFKYTVLYIPSSVLIIYVFALEKGWVSKLLTNKLFVWMGNISACTFLIHQLVLRYIYIGFEMVLKLSVNPWILAGFSFGITILCTEIWMKFFQPWIFSRLGKKGTL